MNVNDPKDAAIFLNQLIKDYCNTLQPTASFAVATVATLALQTLTPKDPDVPAN